MEFVADKIPYIDSTWDAISTAIRPTVGAVIGVLLAGDADHPRPGRARRRRRRDRAALALGQGRQPAGDQHLARAGQQHRASLTEDVAVLARGLVRDRAPARGGGDRRRAAASPGSVLLYVLARLVRRGWRRWKARRATPRRRRRHRDRWTSLDPDVRAAVTAPARRAVRRPSGDPRARRARRRATPYVALAPRPRLPGPGRVAPPAAPGEVPADGRAARWSGRRRRPTALADRGAADPRPADPERCPTHAVAAIEAFDPEPARRLDHLAVRDHRRADPRPAGDRRPAGDVPRARGQAAGRRDLGRGRTSRRPRTASSRWSTTAALAAADRRAGAARSARCGRATPATASTAAATSCAGSATSRRPARGAPRSSRRAATGSG